jgi:hypothetical protein
MKKFFVLAFAALMAVAFAVPAGAFEGKFEAVLMYDITVVDTDEDYQRNNLGNTDDSSWSSTQIDLNPFGYVGFRLTGKNVGVRVNFEPRGNSDDVNGSDTTFLRQHYAYWDVNDWFQLVVGQLASKHSRLGPTTVTTSRTPIADQTFLGSWGLGHGNIFPTRIPQIQGNFRVHETTLIQLAIIENDNGEASGLPSDPFNTLFLLGGAGAGTSQANAMGRLQMSEETDMPRFDITVQFDWGPIGFYPSIMFMERSFESDGYFRPAIGTPDIDVWNLAIPFKISMWGFTFENEWAFGENWGNSNLYPHGDNGGVFGMDWPQTGGLPTSRAVLNSAGQISDTECFSVWAELRYKWGIFTPGIIYSYQEIENGSLGGGIVAGGGAWTNVPAGTAITSFETDREWFQLFCSIAAAPHWNIQPFISWYDQGTIDINGRNALNGDLGDVVLYGVNFIIAF